MALENVSDSFCEYTFTAENVKLYIMEGYNYAFFPTEQKGDSSILHSHQWYELFFLEEGSMHCYFQEEVCALQAGDLFIIKPGTLHCTDIGQTQGKIGGANFFFEIINHMEPVPWLPLFSFEKYAILPFDQECRMLASFFSGALKKKQGMLAGSYLFSFLTRIACLQLPDKKVYSDTDSDMGRLYKIDQILQQCYKKPPYLSEIAEELHLSERQLARIIEKHYGCSYREQIVRLRMQEAVGLLNQGLSVKDVAYTVGYESVRAFQSAFVKQYGTSPGTFTNNFRL